MKNYYLGNVKRWNISEDPKDEQFFLNKDKNIPVILEKLLIQRNIKSEVEAKAFLNPSLEALHDPFLLEGMDVAADRIISAVKNDEKILVYGDYDVDGVTAASILIRFLKSLNIKTDFYIPDRADEGYGISDIATDFISEHDYSILITVDCGITARFQVDTIYEKYAKSGKSIDVIITDHHQCNNELIPDALAVIDPHIPGSKYPFKSLCGAGLALKLVQAVSTRLSLPKAYEEYLDLAALATVADVVELTGENRVIVKYGIQKIINTPCIGIKALLKAAEIHQSQVDSYRISFGLAPRINAAGRMGCANDAVILLTTENEIEAANIAAGLNQSNIKRQETQEEIFNSAVQIIESDTRYINEKIIVVSDNGWHHGVIGIVASKLVDRYHKPAFVIAIDDDKAVGSGRSIEGFNLFSAMEHLSELLVKFGGHEQAGGMTIKTQDLQFFRDRINAYAEKHISSDMLIPALSVHLQVTSQDININTAKLITELEPFGCGNQMPLFCYKGAVLSNIKLIGNGKHLKLTLDIDGKKIEGVYFGKGYLEKGMFTGDVVDIVFTQEVNVWQNKESLQIKVYDMHLQDSELKRNRFLLNSAHQVESLDCEENWLYNGIKEKTISFDDILVDRSILGIIYKYIVQKEIKTLSFYDLFMHARLIEAKTQKNINCFKLFLALYVFDELGLIELKLETDGTLSIILPEEVNKVNLEDSEILDWVNNTVQGLN